MATPASTPGPARGHPTQAGLPLLRIATARLMLVLADTAVAIALPSIQRDLAAAASALPRSIAANAPAFGSLLLFGGRAGDPFRRRRVLRMGPVVFAVASLIAARGLQGAGAALVAPNALALIATTFPAGRPRNAAVAAYAAMSALGITVGVLPGGLLTGLLSWRWVFLTKSMEESTWAPSSGSSRGVCLSTKG